MKSSEDWSKLGGILIAVVAVLMVAVLGPRLLGKAAGPEAEIIAALKGLEKRGVSLSLPGIPAPLTSKDLNYERIAVRVEPGAQRAEVLATLDFTGALGVEQVFFVLRDGDWVPETLAAPRLAAVVGALEARRKALDQGDAAALARLWGAGEEDGGGGSGGVGEPELETILALKQRRYRAEAWFLRLEREDAVATEHWHLQGDLPSRPVDQQGERRLNLLRHGEEFLFSAAVR